MSEFKKSWSVLWPLILTALGAWMVSSLFRSVYWSPVCFWYFGVIAAVLLLMVMVNQCRRRKLAARTIVGVLFCVSLAIGLGFGLFHAVAFLVTKLINGYVSGSFPWYTGFAFAAYFLWPLWLVTGAIWVVLYLRESEKNVRNLRLLFLLMLIGTGVWAILWTAEQIVHMLLYPDWGRYPWHATFVYTLINFGPWMALEGGFYAWLCHRVKHPKKVIQSQPQPDPVKPEPPAPEPINIRFVLTDLALAAIPLAAVAMGMWLIWDSGYVLENICMVLFTAAAVLVWNLLISWLVSHQFQDSRRLRDLNLMILLTFVLTAISAVLWADQFYTAELENTDAGYFEGFQYLLALGYFGPILLGQLLSMVLIRCQEARNRAAIPEKRTWGWAVLLVLVLGINLFITNRLFLGAEYHTDVKPYTSGAKENLWHEGSWQVNIGCEQHIATFWHMDHTISDDGKTAYLKIGTKWSPDMPLRDVSTKYGLNSVPDLESIYLYIPGEGYVKALERNPETGAWETVK